ncbi:MAG: ChaN family lipoprotein [Jhaorihella sp.]
MRGFAILLCACLAIPAAAVRAASLSAELLAGMAAADVVLLGEVHDNPGHHAVQAAAVAALRPGAVVWEMLGPETAARFRAGWLDDPGHRAQALEWAEAGWPGFDMYVPIMRAADGAQVYGGLVPRKVATAAMEQGLAAVFGSEAAEYGLMIPLSGAERAAREADQARAHCDALPAEMLPLMVDVQRLRDAVLARAVVAAAERQGAEGGGPVVVITGNGHARTDRGVPEVLARVRPGLRVFALGQSEDGAIEGSFDAVLDSPAPDRPDPCAVFARPAAGSD